MNHSQYHNHPTLKLSTQILSTKNKAIKDLSIIEEN